MGVWSLSGGTGDYNYSWDSWLPNLGDVPWIMGPALWVFAPWRTVVRSEVKLFLRFQTGVATCIMLWIILGGDIHTGLGPGFIAKWRSQANEGFIAAGSSCDAADPVPATASATLAAATLFSELGGKSAHMSLCSRCLAYLCQAIILEVCLFEDFFSHLLRTVWLLTLGYHASRRHKLSHDGAGCGVSLPILVGGVSLLLMAAKVLYFRGPRRAFRFPRISNYFNFELGMLPMLAQLPELIPLLLIVPEGAAQAAESAIYASVLQMLGATPTDAVADPRDGPLLEEATTATREALDQAPKDVLQHMVPITVVAIIIYASSCALQCVQKNGHANPERVPVRRASGDGDAVLWNDDKPSWRLQRHETMVKLTRIIAPLFAAVRTIRFNQQAQTALLAGTIARANPKRTQRGPDPREYPETRVCIVHC